jgi:hypothetical protein
VPTDPGAGTLDEPHEREEQQCGDHQRSRRPHHGDAPERSDAEAKGAHTVVHDPQREPEREDCQGRADDGTEEANARPPAMRSRTPYQSSASQDCATQPATANANA